MVKKSILVAILALAATPAFADMSSCYEPIPPAATDGNIATEAQMKSAHNDVLDFIKASDDYQNCLNSEYIALEKKAKASKDKTPVDPSIKAGVQTKIDNNQKMKERVGAEYNASAIAYNAKHPKTP
jgi:hypothetical protein